MPKGISQAELSLNSEKIKPVALAIIVLHLSEESTNQSVSQSVSWLVGLSVGRSVSQEKIPLNKICNVLKAY